MAHKMPTTGPTGKQGQTVATTDQPNLFLWKSDERSPSYAIDKLKIARKLPIMARSVPIMSPTGNIS